MLLYQVHWRSSLTGSGGVLTGPVSRYLAEFRLLREREGRPHMQCWIEPARR